MMGFASITFGYLALTVGLLACFVRVVRGPSLADRVLAVDLMTVTGAALMALSAMWFDDSVFLDIALILIVTGFVGTAAFAQFIERQQRRETAEEPPAERLAKEDAR